MAEVVDPFFKPPLDFFPVKKEILVPVDKSERPAQGVTSGTVIPWTMCAQLSAALIAVGCQLRKDPPYVYHIYKGKSVVRFHHQAKSKCGRFDTTELIKAWKDDVAFARKHPTHPFVYAMHAIKNLLTINQHLHNATPFVSYRTNTGVTIAVLQGSQKHRKCVEQGLTQI